MTEFLIRPAQMTDAADLAILDNMAGHGISHWFWQQAVDQGEANDALDWGRSRFASDEIFAWSNAYVVVDGDMVAGGITSYLMPNGVDEGLADLKRTAPAFMPVFELYEMAAGHWFIDSFATFQEHQNKGLGNALFKNSIMRGKHSGAKQVMLVCEDTNEQALSLYKKHDFVKIAERPFLDFGLNHNVNKWLLMAAEY